MLKKREDMFVEFASIRGGNGEIECRRLERTVDDLYGKGRNFSIMTVQPGQSIGYHQHNGDTEWFYIIKGTGIYNDNGVEKPFTAGDLLICYDGEYHALVNNSDEPIEMLVLILYTK